MTISSLERARTVFQSEWGAEENRGPARTFGQSCQDELCCLEAFPEFREWSELHGRWESWRGDVPRAPLQLQPTHCLPLRAPVALQAIKASDLVLLPAGMPLQYTPNACCQSDMCSFIHSNIGYWTLSRGHRGHSRNHPGGKNLPPRGYSKSFSCAVLMFSSTRKIPQWLPPASWIKTSLLHADDALQAQTQSACLSSPKFHSHCPGSIHEPADHILHCQV